MQRESIVFECADFALKRNNQLLFTPMSQRIAKGSVVLITGVNGIGKSSLLSFLNGESFAFQGHLTHRPTTQETLFLTQLHAPQTQLPYSLLEVAELICHRPIQSRGEQTTINNRNQLDHHRWFSPTLQKKRWNQASGGERMRALLAGALSSSAEVLLLDEPFNHLDTLATESVEQALLEGHAHPAFSAKTIFLVTHNVSPKFTQRLSDRCVSIQLIPAKLNEVENGEQQVNAQ